MIWRTHRNVFIERLCNELFACFAVLPTGDVYLHWKQLGKWRMQEHVPYFVLFFFYDQEEIHCSMWYRETMEVRRLQIFSDVIYDYVIWPVRGSSPSSSTWFIAELHLNRRRIARFIMDIKNHVERFTTGHICINWVVTWLWGHKSTVKGHRNLLLANLV